MRISKGNMIVILMAALAMLLASCGGDGSGSGITGGSGTTTIAGKVALSSVSSTSEKALFKSDSVAKASRKAASGEGSLSDISVALKGSELHKMLFANTTVYTGSAMPGAVIQLFDADHPEWLFPVAEELTGPDGSYTFDKTKYAAENAQFGATYGDNAPIPGGFYTLIASKYYASSGKLFVATQPIIKSFSGEVSGNDLVAQNSDMAPNVVTMFGLRPKGDGTFGGVVSCAIPAGEPRPAQCVDRNGKVMITFNAAMARGTITGDTVNSVVSAISVVNSSGVEIDGTWKMSPDILSAFFDPTGLLIPGESYTVTVAGGKATNAARNIYGKPLPDSITGVFVATDQEDISPPSVTFASPAGAEKNSMKIYTPLRISSEELLDMTNFQLIQQEGPSIGDKPHVIYVKYSQGLFYYDIIPSVPFSLGQRYTLAVTGGKDLAGNEMYPTQPITFTVEDINSSDGIDPLATPEDQLVQVAAKYVFGKWIRALNDRSIALLTPYMAGDFAWIQNGTSSEDINRDGRLSLGEFAQMIKGLYERLEGCGAIVTPIFTRNIEVNSPSSASVSFALDIWIPDTATDPMCVQMKNDMPDESQVYLNNINGVWLITSGADYYIPGGGSLQKLDKIELVTPFADELYDAPTEGSPLTPTFRWNAVANVTTYAVVLVDSRGLFGQDGWVALVNGVGIAEGDKITVDFSGIGGNSGQVYVLEPYDEMYMTGDKAFRDVFGFQRMSRELKPGGRYNWAVVGLDKLTFGDFANNLVRDVVSDVIASSNTREFSVDGFWKEIGVTFRAGSYEYSPYIIGYDVGTDSTAFLTIHSPSDNPTTGYLYLEGYGNLSYPLTFDGNGDADVTLDLYNRSNRVFISDDAEGHIKFFTILTKGGELPVIQVTSIIDNSTGLPVLPDPIWGNIDDSTASGFHISGIVNDPAVTSMWLNLSGDMGWFPSMPVMVNTSTTPNEFTVYNVPVYEGYNQIRLEGSGANYYEYKFDVHVRDGSGTVFVNPIEVSIAGATETFSDRYMMQFDAGSASSVTLNIAMERTGGGYDHYLGENWYWAGNGMINSSTSGFPEGSYTQYDRSYNVIGGDSAVNAIGNMTFDLYQGLNIIRLYDDGWYNWRELRIYTTGGPVYAPPVASIAAVPNSGNLTKTGGDFVSARYEGDASDVVITGIASNFSSMPGGMRYRHYWMGGYSGDLFADINSDGSFSIPIALKTGNNDIYVYDPDGQSAYVYIDTTGGTPPDQWIKITSPLHDSVIGFDATLKVSFQIDNSIDNWNPYYFSANTNNYTSGGGEGFLYSDGTINYDPISLTGWFLAEFEANDMYYISVYAHDGAKAHRHTIYVNNKYNYGDYFYKASVGKAGLSMTGIMAQEDFKRQQLERKQDMMNAK